MFIEVSLSLIEKYICLYLVFNLGSFDALIFNKHISFNKIIVLYQDIMKITSFLFYFKNYSLVKSSAFV